jgi:hypothetical protein
MRTADTTSNLGYYELTNSLDISKDIEIGSKEWYQEIKKKGYTHAYRWINSDNEWMYFANNEARAEEGRTELFSKEKKEEMKHAREWSYEHVDIYSLDEIINDWF